MSLQKIEISSFQDKIEWLWERVKDQDYYWDDLSRGNHMALLSLLFDSSSEHFYNESGMVSITSIQSNINANIHFMLWDMKYPVKKILGEARDIFRDLFSRYSLSRITATIPAINKGAVRLAVLLGMKFEGTMREAFLYKGQYYDIYIYAILKREFEEKGKVN